MSVNHGCWTVTRLQSWRLVMTDLMQKFLQAMRDFPARLKPHSYTCHAWENVRDFGFNGDSIPMDRNFIGIHKDANNTNKKNAEMQCAEKLVLRAKHLNDPFVREAAKNI